MARWPDTGFTFAGPARGWIPTREADRIANRIKPRAVVSWELVGASYRHGYRIPGYGRLHLEGGGWMWFPERTSLDEALARAADHGFNVTDIRAQLARWVETGKGVTFQLKHP